MSFNMLKGDIHVNIFGKKIYKVIIQFVLISVFLINTVSLYADYTYHTSTFNINYSIDKTLCPARGSCSSGGTFSISVTGRGGASQYLPDGTYNENKTISVSSQKGDFITFYAGSYLSNLKITTSGDIGFIVTYTYSDGTKVVYGQKPNNIYDADGNYEYSDYGSIYNKTYNYPDIVAAKPETDFNISVQIYWQITDETGVPSWYYYDQFDIPFLQEDSLVPTFSKAATVIYNKATNCTDVNWDGATDPCDSTNTQNSASGLFTTPYCLYESFDNGQSYSEIASNIKDTNYSIPFDENMRGKTVQFKITVEDYAGNIGSETTSISYSPNIESQVSLETGKSDTQNYYLDVNFELSPQVVKNNFSQIKILRTNQDTSSSVILSELVLNISDIPLDSSGTFTANDQWKKDGNGNLYYVDVIPISSGAGHKSWGYQIDDSILTSPGPAMNIIVLPNNEGSVSYTITDGNGKIYGVDSSFGQKVGRTFTLTVQGSDVDQDQWKLGIYKITKTTVNGVVLTSYQRLNGTSDAVYSYSNGYSKVSYKINLTENDNYICVKWKESDDSQCIYTSNTIEDIYLEKQAITGTNGIAYTVTVKDYNGNNVPTDNASIVTRPGEELTLSISSTDSFNWDFGDGSSSTGTSNETHTYHQSTAVNQKSATYEYTLKISDTTVSGDFSLTVTVQDTQDGTLLESETWHGDHTIIGVVEIPSGLSLTIANDDATVSFEGNDGNGYEQGILVDSGGVLNIDTISTTGSTIFQSINGQTENWGTIQILGTANIKLASITQSERAVSIGVGGVAALTGITFSQNEIALHVVGNGTNSPSVTVNNCNFKSNSIYGIKEDAGGRPITTGSNFYGNYYDYYSYDGGILALTDINSLTTHNTGNTNTQE